MKKGIVVLLVLLGLIVALPLLSLALLNSQWLQAKLIAIANEQLDAELAIESLSFKPFKGKAALKGGSFSQQDETADLDVTLDTVELEVNLRPLLYRSIQIRHLELVEPRITSVVRRIPTSEGEDSQPDQQEPEKDQPEIAIQEFLIRNGAVDLTVLREGFDPVRFSVTDIDYSARNVSLESYRQWLFGADIHCIIDAGGKTTLDKSASSTPSTFSLNDVNLSYVSQIFEQTARTFVIKDGQMDVNSVLSPDGVHFKVDLDGLTLAENPKGTESQFMFIPVEKLVQYVNKQEGKMLLEFELGEDVRTSEDLEYIISEFWKGLWIALLKHVSPGSLEDLIEEGKQRVLEEGAEKLLDKEKTQQLEEGAKKALDLFKKKDN